MTPASAACVERAGGTTTHPRARREADLSLGGVLTGCAVLFIRSPMRCLLLLICQASAFQHLAMPRHLATSLRLQVASVQMRESTVLPGPLGALEQRVRNSPARWRGRIDWLKEVLASEPQTPQPLPPLPEGWHEVVDEASGRPYYVTPEGTSTWERPMVWDVPGASSESAATASPEVTSDGLDAQVSEPPSAPAAPAAPVSSAELKPAVSSSSKDKTDDWKPKRSRYGAGRSQAARDLDEARKARKASAVRQGARRQWNAQPPGSNAWSAKNNPFEYQPPASQKWQKDMLQRDPPREPKGANAPQYGKPAPGLADNFRKSSARDIVTKPSASSGVSSGASYLPPGVAGAAGSSKPSASFLPPGVANRLRDSN